jgi:hypothetical protein
VAWEQIVKGYEYDKGQFVVLTKEDFDKVNVASNQTVDIREFVDLADIDPMFYDQPYFLAPEKGGDKAYALLREALTKSGKVGIAKVVIKTREHLAAVKPLGKALVLELMHFPDELADPNELNLPDIAAHRFHDRQVAARKVEGRVPRGDDEADRGKSGRARQGTSRRENRRTQGDQCGRPGFSVAGEPQCAWEGLENQEDGQAPPPITSQGSLSKSRLGFATHGR